VNLLLLAGAGVVAGAVNSAVGSGTLLTYPLLLASGLPPVVANGTNTLGLFPGSLAAAWGYRREMAGRARGLVPMMAVMAVGALLGALAVISFPGAFAAIVPWLILAACVLVVVQPWVARRMQLAAVHPDQGRHRGLLPTLLGAGGYSGYFGAAQGMILMAVLTTLYDHDLQRSNGVKNLLAAVGNVMAAAVFVIAGSVSWPAAVAVGAGATVGGLVGSPVARRLPQAALRALLVVVGVIAAVASFLKG
jgi:uncharacterized membrane protein YfcA